IYMGSAPTQRTANHNVDDRRVKLGCIQPGKTVATFSDTLRRLTDATTYLYKDNKRYWYSTVPTMTRLAEDRASQLSDHDLDDEIQKRLRETTAHARTNFSKVHTCVSNNDIPDEHEVHLVILSPKHPHTTKNANSPTRQKTAHIVESRDNNPRNYKNT